MDRKEYLRNYYLRNKEKLDEYRKNYLKIYREINKDKIRVSNKLYKKRTYKVKVYDRYHSDSLFKLARALRCRLNQALKLKCKNGSAIKDLGCSAEELIKHLESQFQDGMSWENYGKWHVDHIKPLASFELNNVTQFKLACHYSNLQPLWAADNLRKGSRIIS